MKTKCEHGIEIEIELDLDLQWNQCLNQNGMK